MDYKTWEPYYRRIIDDFDFSIKDDAKAAATLNTLLAQRDNPRLLHRHLAEKIAYTDTVVCGAGPSIDSAITHHRPMIEKEVVIAADGATSALLNEGVLPTIIVTDLDGDIDDQREANKQGSIIVLHAHGDNIETIRTYVPTIQGEILGTTQGNPGDFPYLSNFGGFTDGDRAAFLADHFQANQIYLLGFDFNATIGLYSLPHTKDIQKKQKKLQWCRYLLTVLGSHRPLVFL